MEHDGPSPTPRPADLARVLREEVGGLRRRESRRVFGVSVHVGTLGGPRRALSLHPREVPALDTGMRTDVLSRLLEDVPGDPAWAWLTRPGVPELHDLDVAWSSAARFAFDAHGRVLSGFYALTRTGWLDVHSGASRTWKRLRL